jgi:hypothetical protein
VIPNPEKWSNLCSFSHLTFCLLFPFTGSTQSEGAGCGGQQQFDNIRHKMADSVAKLAGLSPNSIMGNPRVGDHLLCILLSYSVIIPAVLRH